MSKTIVSIILVVLFFFALIFGIYSIVNNYKNTDLSAQKSLLDQKLSSAKDKLDKAKQTLGGMIDSLSKYFSFGLDIQVQMNEAVKLVKQTNFLFTDPDGANPEFIVVNFAERNSVSESRKEINQLILNWKKKTDILYIGNIDTKEAEQIRQDAEKIKDFLDNLFNTVQSFTPENSGLSQTQINLYLEQLPSGEAINKVIENISNAIVSENSQPTTDNNTPPVTPEEVVNQQTIVEEIEEEVETIEEEIIQVEEQIIQTQPPAPIEQTPPPVVPPVVTPPESNNFLPGRRKITPSTGIIIQPGPAKLIQGIDDH